MNPLLSLGLVRTLFVNMFRMSEDLSANADRRAKWRDICGLRAIGAFLVSAERKGDEVSGLRILSEKGRDCTVVNPWPGEAVRAVRNGKAAETMRGARFTLKTAPGENVELTAVQSHTVPAAAQAGR